MVYKRVTNVESQLMTPPLDHYYEQLWRSCFRVVVWRQQSFSDQKVLAIAKRAKRDAALNNFPRAWIDERIAIGPTTRRAMDPLDDVEIGRASCRGRV